MNFAVSRFEIPAAWAMRRMGRFRHEPALKRPMSEGKSSSDLLMGPGGSPSQCEQEHGNEHEPTRVAGSWWSADVKAGFGGLRARIGGAAPILTPGLSRDGAVDDRSVTVQIPGRLFDRGPMLFVDHDPAESQSRRIALS